MSILEHFAAASRGHTALDVAPAEARAVDNALTDFGPLISTIVQPDGFIPALAFVGDSVEQTYEAATWSFAAMSANAEAAASLPIVVERLEGGRWTVDREHDANGFVEEPLGPGQRPAWTLSQYLEVMALQLYIVGDTFGRVLTYRGGRMPAIDPWHPHDVTVWDDGRRPTRYQYTPISRTGYVDSPNQLGSSKWYRPRDVFHAMFGSPSSMVRGRSVLSVAIRTMEIDRIAQERVRANLLNKVAPGLIIKHSPSQLKGLAAATGSANTEQRDALIKYLKEEYARTTKDGTPLVIGGSTELMKPPETIDQLSYYDVRRASREEILAVFRTPPFLLGVTDGATYAQARESIKVWWAMALKPLLNQVLTTLNTQVIRRYWPKRGEGQIRLNYSIDESLLGLEIMRARAEVAEIIVRVGHSANDASQRVGLGMPYREELDAAHMGVVVAGHAEDLPGEAAPAEPPAPAAEPAPEEQVTDA